MHSEGPPAFCGLLTCESRAADETNLRCLWCAVLWCGRLFVISCAGMCGELADLFFLLLLLCWLCACFDKGTCSLCCYGAQARENDLGFRHDVRCRVKGPFTALKWGTPAELLSCTCQMLVRALMYKAANTIITWYMAETKAERIRRSRKKLKF